MDEVTDGTLTGLLALLGLNLADPLNLSGLAVPGLNVITTGDVFTGLKLLGLDLGWLPATPNGVASEINNTPYLKLGVDGVLDVVLDKLENSVGIPGVGLLISQLAQLIQDITDPITSHLPDVIDLRVIPTIGTGMGAFAAAMAYQQVLDQLKYQPGGSAYAGLDPLLGSLTILPLVLINNPARPDGGAFARFGALASLFGIDTVNPRTEATSDGTGLPVLGTGIKLGAANVLPIMIDATYEYQPLSDLASWPNPFTLANNLGAGLMPTYMLRGLSLDNLGDQILGQVGDLVQESVLSGNPLALNVYLTLHSATLPMLEPLYLASDFLNIIGLSPLAAIPMKLANALAPAFATLTNIGYANVVRNADGTYTRDFTNAGTETPFLSFADLDYGKVPGDVIGQLISGFTKEFFSGSPTPNTPNVLSNLLNALLGGGLGGILPGAAPAPGGSGATNPLGGLGDVLGGLGGLLGGILGGLGIGAAAAPLATQNQMASDIPEANATFSRLSVSGGATDETATLAADSEKTAATTDAAARRSRTRPPRRRDGQGPDGGREARHRDRDRNHGNRTRHHTGRGGPRHQAGGEAGVDGNRNGNGNGNGRRHRTEARQARHRCASGRQGLDAQACQGRRRREARRRCVEQRRLHDRQDAKEGQAVAQRRAQQPGRVHRRQAGCVRDRQEGRRRQEGRTCRCRRVERRLVERLVGGWLIEQRRLGS